MEESESVKVLLKDTSGNLVRVITEHTPDGIFVATNLPTGEYMISVERS
jgi:hypothetical protein